MKRSTIKSNLRRFALAQTPAQQTNMILLGIYHLLIEFAEHLGMIEEDEEIKA